MNADNAPFSEDRDLWEFLRAIEARYGGTWAADSPMAARLRLLQERYDPSGATDGR